MSSQEHLQAAKIALHQAQEKEHNAKNKMLVQYLQSALDVQIYTDILLEKQKEFYVLNVTLSEKEEKGKPSKLKKHYK